MPEHFVIFFFFYECLGIQFFNSHTCGLRDAMPRQRSFTLFTHMWLTGHYAMPEVTHALFSTQLFSVIPYSSVDYRQVFRSILYFQPCPSQSDSRLYPTQPFLPWVLHIWESVFYSQAFFTLHSLYLGKQRISLGVIGILSMYLCLHT